MKLNIAPDLYEGIFEIYEAGCQSVVVVTNDHRTVKITAHKVLRGCEAQYIADYEQLIDQKVDGRDIQIWAKAPYPFAHGQTVEACIRYAMGFVNSQRV